MIPLEGIILLGRSGQVARSVLEVAESRGLQCNVLARPDIDLTDVDGVAVALSSALASATGRYVVVNAAAYTDVDGAEREEGQARVINAWAPARIAEICRQHATPFVHISTDYVFDGQGRVAYSEQHAPNPINAYGRTKLEGERGVTAAGGNAAILRTSWVVSAFGRNFLKTMLRLAKSCDEVRVVADQVGCPTTAHDIASAIVQLAGSLAQDPLREPEIFHYCGRVQLSWAGLARRIYQLADCETIVRDIRTDEFPSLADRPAWSVMDCAAITDRFSIEPPDLDRGLSDVLSRLST